MKIKIRNAALIREKDIISNRNLYIQGKKLVPGFNGRPDLIIDAGGRFASAGFIDLHVHGPANVVSREALFSGTTGFLFTPLVRNTKELFCQLKKLPRRDSLGAKILGTNLEGVFINKLMRGAIPPGMISRPSRKIANKLIGLSRKSVKIITLAPEIKGNMKMIPWLVRKKIIVGLGHTAARAAVAKEAIDHGATYATHTFNRMSKPKNNDPGVLGVVLHDKGVTCEVIADGIHVSPQMLKMLINVKGVDRVVLVTDSVACADLKNFVKDKKVFRLKNGHLAGSDLTMIAAIRNMVKLAGVGLAPAVKMATLNPARMLGLNRQKGSLSPGKDADIVIFDRRFKVWAVMREGKVRHNCLQGH